DVQAAGVEDHALADDGYERPARLAPGDLDHPRRAPRGGGPAYGVHRRIVRLVQAFALDDGHLRAVLLGDLAGDGLDLPRPPVVGRGGDQGGGRRAGVRPVAGLGDVDALGHEPGARTVLLVAVEAIAPQREGERDLVAGETVRGLGDPVGSGLQLR